MLKIKKGFIIRKVGKEYIVVAVGPASEKLKGMIKLNEVGVSLWNEMEAGIRKEDLVTKMIERYEGLDRATAESDLEEFLESIHIAIEM